MRFPSTTEILKWAGFYDGYPEVDAQRQRDIFDRGILVGKSANWLAQRKTVPWTQPHPELDGYLDGYRLFLKEHDFLLELWERKLICAAIGFMSHPDQIGRLDKQDSIVEIKSGGYRDAPTRLQTGGQATAFRYVYGSDILRYCLHLPGDGKYNLIPHTDKNDLAEFVALVQVANIAMKYDLPLGRKLKQIMEERPRD